ncbi:MAG TPA: hypothetical protein VKU00_17920 [Chthonomonadaceae bacterium]|nr:hypothetical protein [Chthonomonadaceae bacterium]
MRRGTTNGANTLRIVGAGLTILLFILCGVGPRSWAGPPDKSAPQPVAPSALYAPEDVAAFSQRFQQDIWPLLARKSSNCVGCHTNMNPSQLHLVGTPDALFKVLIADGHFEPDNAASLLARVTAPAGPTHMPPAPYASWTDAEIATLRAFVNDLAAKRQKHGVAEDEQFPPALLAAYTGKKPTSGLDNTFLTYYQLRTKVNAIFHDDWVRDDKDLYEENLAQFGGADFKASFNENTRPTAQFLAGVDTLSKDVAARAYLTASGPFTGRAEHLPSPLGKTAPDAVTAHEIQRLYRKMLFREATPDELKSSFRFLQSIYRAQTALAAQDYDLRFELTARDEHGLTASVPIKIHVSSDSYGLGQTLVNENTPGEDDKAKIGRFKLDGPFTLKAKDPEQKVVISNAGSRGNLIVHAIEVHGPLPDGPTRIIVVTDPGVQPQGAWKLTQQNGIPCYEDDNTNKGASTLTIPLPIEQDGQYELTFAWRRAETVKDGGRNRRGYGAANAENVLVEVISHDKHRIAVPQPLPVPPQGVAAFSVDESDDALNLWKSLPAFKFGADDGVEINNTDTRGQVVADAFKFVPATLPGVKPANAEDLLPFTIPARDAVGQDKWQNFVRGEFQRYQGVGPRLVSDSNDPALKGKLSLLYRPALRTDDFKPDAYYRLEFGFPGAVQNDTAVPILVHARESTPILQAAYPARTHSGATMTLDASGSYNTQHAPLQFTWRQTGGAEVKLSDPHAAKISFAVPGISAQEAAWQGLCRALMKHPDFLFTRPLALATTRDPQTRRRLQLVKIAQDLVGRTPTDAELAKLDSGASLASLIDAYLETPEFKAFYFRRIRLYLESHGTDEDDEPARLWAYIAFNNRPFKEILTADYTVGTDGQKEPRPEYYGRSGVLTMKGFIKGKPGLPHFNYPAMVCEKFLGYVFEVPPEVLKIRDGIAAASTVSPSSICYSCHKVLTPLAYQRTRWTDDGVYQAKENGKPIDDTDRQVVASYPFKGNGMEAFATQAQNKERFIRTQIQTHFVFYFGREMRYDQDERGLYKRLWNTEKANNYQLKGLIRAILLSPEYLNGGVQPAPTSPIKPAPKSSNRHLAHR